MLTFERWIKDQSKEIFTMNVEYREIDFYGPFLGFKLERKYAGKEIKVYPIRKRIETPEISGTDFYLIVKASKELFQKIGKFKLCLKEFDIIIDSDNTEELILEELKRIPLF